MAIGKFGGKKPAGSKSKSAPPKSRFKGKARDEDEDEDDDTGDEDEDESDDSSDDEDEDEDEKPSRGSKKTSKKSPAKKTGSKKKAGGSRGGSRWGGVGWGNQRDPMLEVGDYVLKVGECTVEPSPKDRRQEWFKGKVEVVEASKKSGTEEGAVCTILANTGTDPGLAEMARFLGTAAGAENEDDYREKFDADGEAPLIEACVNTGEDSPVFGRFLHCRVSRGNPVLDQKGNDTGDYYRRYDFSVVDESDQEVEAPEV